MAKTKTMRIDTSLVDIFGRVGKAFADRVKKEYNLAELFVSDVLASQLVAGKIRGVKSFNFKIRKTGRNSGVMELV